MGRDVRGRLGGSDAGPLRHVAITGMVRTAQAEGGRGVICCVALRGLRLGRREAVGRSRFREGDDAAPRPDDELGSGRALAG